MKLLIASSFLIVAVGAIPGVPIFKTEILAPFNGMLKNLLCVTPTVDQLTMQYDIEHIWNEKKKRFI